MPVLDRPDLPGGSGARRLRRTRNARWLSRSRSTRIDRTTRRCWLLVAVSGDIHRPGENQDTNQHTHNDQHPRPFTFFWSATLLVLHTAATGAGAISVCLHDKFPFFTDVERVVFPVSELCVLQNRFERSNRESLQSYKASFAPPESFQARVFVLETLQARGTRPT